MSDQVEELKREVSRFLFEFKQLMIDGNYNVKGHLKNIQALADLEITARERDRIIQSLQVTDYSKGPITDEYKPEHCLWLFGKDVQAVEVYIKLKISTDSKGNEKVICLSFHPSEHTLRYPFRN